MAYYPILMADIIHSRKANSNLVMDEFKILVGELNRRWRKEILSPITITLGDEFQGVVTTTESALQIIFDFEEEIIKQGFSFKLRYVLNYGKIDTPINRKVAHEMLGEGLTSAREKLSVLKVSKNRFSIMDKQSKDVELLNDLFLIYENYVDGWKKRDLPIVKQFLLNNDYKRVAQTLSINISSAWKRQRSLNIQEYYISKKLILNLNNKLRV